VIIREFSRSKAVRNAYKIVDGKPEEEEASWQTEARMVGEYYNAF
jgi:RNA polymerase-interacting CarD/CdnL/TRCF family regulator